MTSLASIAEILAGSMANNSGLALPEYSNPDAPIKNACGAYLFYQDSWLSLLQNEDAESSDINTAHDRMVRSRDPLKRQLLLRKTRRYDFRGRRFSIDKLGRVHCCPLRPGLVSPLGRVYGAPISARA